MADLATASYHVVACDIAPAAIAASRRGAVDLDGVEYLVADVRSVRFSERVDTWHDRAVFHFLTVEADQHDYVRSAAAAIRPGGHVVMATFSPDGPDTCSGLPAARHDAASLSRIFATEFELVESAEADHVTPWGSRQRFTHATLRRRIFVEPFAKQRQRPTVTRPDSPP